MLTLFIDWNQSICVLYSQNLQKQTRIFFQNGWGGGAQRAGPGSAFEWISLHFVLAHLRVEYAFLLNLHTYEGDSTR